MLRVLVILSLAFLGACTSSNNSQSSHEMREPANVKYFEELEKPNVGPEALLAAKDKLGLLFHYARVNPVPFFEALRSRDEVLKLQGFGLKISGPLTGKEYIDKQVIPPVVVVSRYDDVVEALKRNYEFQVIPNRENMNNTVGPYILAYEGTEEFGSDHKGSHPGTITPHSSSSKPRNYTIDFEAEKKHMWELVSGGQFDKQRVREISAAAVTEALSKAGVRKGAQSLDVVKHITRYVPLAVVRNFFGLRPTGNTDRDNKLLAFWSRWTQNSFFHNPKRDDDINNMARYAVRGLDRYKSEAGTRRRPKNPYFGKRASADADIDRGMNYWVKQTIATRKAFLKQKGVKSFQQYSVKVPAAQRATIDLVLLAAPMHKHAGINEDRIISNIMGLLVGAVETGSAAISQALEVILNDKETGKLGAYKALVDAVNANNQDMINKVVWEALRFNPINPWVARIAVVNTKIGNVDVAKGTLVLIATESAMMDPTRFTNPEEFRTDRNKDLYLHMGGYRLDAATNKSPSARARHVCLGYGAAYEFVPVTIGELFKKFPNIRKSSSDQELSFSADDMDQDYRNPFPEKYVLRID